MIIQRRSFLIGLGALLAAPAIVHAANLMPIKRVQIALPPHPWYDSEAWERARLAAFEKAVNPPLLATRNPFTNLTLKPAHLIVPRGRFVGVLFAPQHPLLRSA